MVLGIGWIGLWVLWMVWINLLVMAVTPRQCNVQRRSSSFLGISCEGNEKKLLELLTVLDEEQRHEVLASPSKPKGRKELKNLECSINFDGISDTSRQGKGKRVASAG